MVQRMPQYTEHDLGRFLELFDGREEVFAKQSENAYFPVKPERQLSEGDVREHLSGSCTYGIYILKRDNTTKILCFDIDLPKKQIEQNLFKLPDIKEPLLDDVNSIVDELRIKLGLTEQNYLIEDTGGRGYHIWVFFDQSLPSKDVRLIASAIGDSANIHCEIFPAADEVESDRYGKLVKLPLGLHRKYGKMSTFIVLRHGKAEVVADPFRVLHAIQPVPRHAIEEFLRNHVPALATSPSTYRLGAAILEAESTAAISDKEIAPLPNIGHIFSHCAAFHDLRIKANSDHHLTHDERLALACVLINVEDGDRTVHEVIRNCQDYDATITQGQLDYLRKRRMSPITCRWMIEQDLCKGFCHPEIEMQDSDQKRPNPSPIRFAKWGNVSEPEKYWESKELSFDGVYSRANLYRAWEQVKHYVKERRDFWDTHAFAMFEKHLDASIECLHHELLNEEYTPMPYRAIDIPKKKIDSGYEFRRIKMIHPRDHVVAQAIVNVIGGAFEKTFSDNSLGYRLDLGVGKGFRIFLPWQDKWETRKWRVLNFQYQPKDYYYVIADIKSFYDEINHTRLLGFLIERLPRNSPIPELIRKFMQNSFIEDRGLESLIESGETGKGIPQGPCFSGFLANVYLDDLDHYMEKICVDYIRYVDDIVLLARSKDEAKKVKNELEEKLNELGLRLNTLKTYDPKPVTEIKPLLDLITEMKYGIAGVLLEQESKQEYLPEVLEPILDEFAADSAKFDARKLQSIANHLGYYVRMKRRIHGRIDQTVLQLSKEVIANSILKPGQLYTVIEAMLQAEPNCENLLKFMPSIYSKVVLAQAVGNLRKTSEGAYGLLVQLARDNSSYLVRGVAYNSLRLIGAEVDAVITQQRESSAFVRARAISALVVNDLSKVQVEILNACKDCSPGILASATEVAFHWQDDHFFQALFRLLSQQVSDLPPEDLPVFTTLAIATRTTETEKSLAALLYDGIGHLLLSTLVRASIKEILERASQDDKMISLFFAIKDFAINLGDDSLKRLICKELLALVPQTSRVPENLKQAMLNAHNGIRQAARFSGLSRQRNALYFHKRFEDPKFSILPDSDGRLQYCYCMDQFSKRRVIVEGVPLSLLCEVAGFRDQNDWFLFINRLRSDGLTSVIDRWISSVSADGQEQVVWTAYEVPDDHSLLADEIGKRSFKFEEALGIVRAVFSKAYRIGFLGGPIPVVCPHNILIDSGNQVRLINLLSGLPIPNYISTNGRRLTDGSGTSLAHFVGLLSFELITGGSCPILEYERIKSDANQYSDSSDRLSESTELVDFPLHYGWLLDRLCYSDPSFRYKSYRIFSDDVKRFLYFREHCEKHVDSICDKSIKFWLETLDVLSMRLARELPARSTEGNTSHQKAMAVLHETAHRINSRYTRSACQSRGGEFGIWHSESRKLAGWKEWRGLHAASRACLQFASGVMDRKIELTELAKWKLQGAESIVISYCALKVELAALLRSTAKSMDSAEYAERTVHCARDIRNNILPLDSPQFQDLLIYSGSVERSSLCKIVLMSSLKWIIMAA